MGKKHKGQSSWGAKREGKDEIGPVRQPGARGKWESCLLHPDMLSLKSWKASVELPLGEWTSGHGAQRGGPSQGQPIENYQHVDES